MEKKEYNEIIMQLYYLSENKKILSFKTKGSPYNCHVLVESDVQHKHYHVS